jgi:transcriptional regulator with XRE-family HTH domain
MAQIHPLRAYRERHDPPLSRSQLAKYLGVTAAAVSRWEAGLRKPEEDTLRTIMRKTGIPARDLRPDLAKLLG